MKPKSYVRGTMAIAVVLATIITVLSFVGAGLSQFDTYTVGAASHTDYQDEAEYNAWAGVEITTAVYLPFTNSDPAWDWLTTAVIQNTSTETTNITLRYFDLNGVETAVLNDTLPPMGSRVYTPTGVFSGSLMITGTHPLAVIANESPINTSWSGDGLMSYRGIGSISSPSMSVSTINLLPIYREYNGWNSFLAVQNMGDIEAYIVLQFYDLAGSVVHTQNDALPAHSAHWYDVADIPALGANFFGRAIVHADMPIAGVVHTVNSITGETVAHNNRRLQQVDYENYLPRLNDASTIALYNLAQAQATVLINFYDDTGVNTTYYATSLNANGTEFVILSALPALPAGFQGSAVVSSDQPVGALVNTSWTTVPPATFTGYSGVNQTDTVSYVPFVRKSTDGTTTQLNIQNAGITDANVTITYYDENGQIMFVENATIPPYASANFDQAANVSLPSEFTGSAMVSSSKSVVVSGFISQERQPTDAPPDLSSSYQTVNLTNVESGDILTYTLVLRNSAAVSATAVLTNPIPTHTTYVANSAHASDGHLVTLSGNQLHWSGQVISGTPTIIQFAAKVATGLTVGDPITNDATLNDGAGNITEFTAVSLYNPGYGLSINNGDLYTDNPSVNLSLSWGAESPPIEFMQISNDGGFGTGTGWIAVADIYTGWAMTTYGDVQLPRTVYAKFRNANGVQFGPV
ncbi:MAG: DUF11 domain-containing protein, partial [Chloroflexi bacterium]